jgi:hypothetical protein
MVELAGSKKYESFSSILIRQIKNLRRVNVRLFIILGLMLSAQVTSAQVSDAILTNYRPNFEGVSQKVAARNLAEVSEGDTLGSTYELIETYFTPVFRKSNLSLDYLIGINNQTRERLPMTLIDNWMGEYDETGTGKKQLFCLSFVPGIINPYFSRINRCQKASPVVCNREIMHCLYYGSSQ